MQERRTTIRVDHPCRTQYCSADEALPKDGSLLNLSERGAGVLLREPRKGGERVTVNFPLLGAEETLTTTGVVRWSGEHAQRGRWYPVGLEWLPLEETTAHLLHRLLVSSTQAAAARAPIGRGRVFGRDPATRREVLQWGLLCGLFVAMLCGGVLLALQQDNWRLETVLHARNATVEHLGEQGARLQGELDTAIANLSATSEEVARLHEQAQALEGNAHQFSEEVARFQHSYAQLQRERSALIDRVLELEQERSIVSRRSVSLDELHVVIQETIARKQATRSLYSWVLPGTERDQWVKAGNRGYLVQDGRSTASDRPSIQVRVHEPELRY